MPFWKRQNYGDNKKINARSLRGVKGRWIYRYRSFYEQWKYFEFDIIMMVICHQTFVQIRRMWNTICFIKVKPKGELWTLTLVLYVNVVHPSVFFFFKVLLCWYWLCMWGEGWYGGFLYFPISFVVNLKLLLKSLKKIITQDRSFWQNFCFTFINICILYMCMCLLDCDFFF